MKNRKFLLKDLISDRSFIRWATGKGDPEEAKRWNEWVEYSESNRKLAVQAQKRITGVTFELPEATHRADDWKRIHNEILDKQQKGRVVPLQKRETNYVALFLKTAAVFLILASAGLATLYIMNDSADTESRQLSDAVITVYTDYSEKKTISLTDGSEIILAAGSRLSYKESWLLQPTLHVVLEEGEAFFSIEPDGRDDRSAPRFEVETEDGTTAVMGTRFSVTTYGEGTRVVLEQGEVQVTPSQDNESDPYAAITMQPGEMAQWSKVDPLVTRIRVNPRVYTSWVSDHLYFDDTPLSHLIDRIEKTYGVDVVIEDPTLLDLKLSGALDFYGLDELAGAVSEVLDIQLRQMNNQVFLTK